jgi:hypothetical protein
VVAHELTWANGPALSPAAGGRRRGKEGEMGGAMRR